MSMEQTLHCCTPEDSRVTNEGTSHTHTRTIFFFKVNGCSVDRLCSDMHPGVTNKMFSSLRSGTKLNYNVMLRRKQTVVVDELKTITDVIVLVIFFVNPGNKKTQMMIVPVRTVTNPMQYRFHHSPL